MDISWAFSGDGILAFAGGALALLGVWWSNHQSIKNLEKQILEERKARTEEAKGQKRSLARAFLFEIEDFYHYGVKQQADWGAFDPSQIPHRVVKFRRWPFVMYEANAGRIGNFDDRETKWIIKFYGHAEAYQASVEEFVLNNDAARLGKDRDHVQEQVAVARALVVRLKEIFPALKRSAETVCTVLSEAAGVPREDLRVPLSDFQDEGERKEKGRKPERDA